VDRRIQTLICAIALVAAVGPSRAQTFLPARSIERAAPQPLALPPEPAVIRQEKNGTAFFVDDTGYMLTARHAAEDCSRVFVTKEGRFVAARVVALSQRFDLALLKVPKTMGIAAVFPRSASAAVNDMVFAAAYDMLPPLTARGGMLANATVGASAGSEAGHIAIDSPVTFGASGAPVLGSRGLVEGVISRRTSLSRVLAVGSAEAKAFMSENGIHFAQDDRPQIAGGASRANRAASISARVTCLKN
jgi:S1-C subfamily serine protease